MIDPNNLPELPELMIVGPGPLAPLDLQAMGHQVIAHYGDVWTALHNETCASVGRLLGAGRDPYLIPGSGTTALEMSILNLFEEGQRVVVANTGFFGARLMEIASALRLDVVEVPVEVGAPADPDKIFAAATGAAGVLTVHVDTATGVRHPIAEIAEAAHRAGAIYMVDGIAAAGGETVHVDRMGIDAYVTGTQKGLEAPPGLGIFAIGDGGAERMASRVTKPASWFLDVGIWDKYRSDWGEWHPHPVTMPTNIVLALASSLKRIHGVGIEQWIIRRAELSKHLRDGLAGLGLKPVPQPGVEANLVVAAWAEEPASIQKALMERGLMIAGGLGPTAGKAIRVGLIGATANVESVDRLLQHLAEIL